MGENHPALIGAAAVADIADSRMMLRDRLTELRHVEAEEEEATGDSMMHALWNVVEASESLLRDLDERDPTRQATLLQKLRRSRPEDVPAFMQFWEMYGRCGPRKVAWETWCKHVAAGASPDAILEGLARWVAYWLTPGVASVKWPQGWLNERRWEDDPPVAVLSSQRPQSHTDGIMARMRQRAAQR